MERRTIVACLAMVGLLVFSVALPSTVRGADEEEGFTPIFDGKTLDGWDGDPKCWRVEQGAITGQTTTEHPLEGNTFLIWRRGKVDDFELRLEYRIENHNSGVQYRSWEEPKKWGKWVVGGYQADIAIDTPKAPWSGQLYAERDRGILAYRGQKTIIGDDHKPKVVGSVGDTEQLVLHIKRGQWNELTIIARGYHFVHKINGHVMMETTDQDESKRRRSGILALQLHSGPPMKVQFRNIRLK
jgi:hypothetical protein